MEPAAPAVEVQSLNHWTAREVPEVYLEQELVGEKFRHLLSLILN